MHRIRSALAGLLAVVGPRSLFLGLVAAAMLGAAVHAAEEPGQFVQRLGDQAAAIVNDTSTGEAERRSALGRMLAQALDFELIASLVLGRHWQGVDGRRRSELAALFQRYLLTTLTRRLAGAAGARLTVGLAEDKGQLGVFVESRWVEPEGGPTPATWRLRAVEGRWRVYDLVVGGVSLVATQRDEIDELVGEGGGLDALIAGLREVIERLEGSDST